MNKPPPDFVARSFRLNDALRDTAARFAQAEEELDREFRSRLLAENRQFQLDIHTLETWRSGEAARIEAARDQKNEYLENHFQKRAKRIEASAHKLAGNIRQQAQRAKESWLGGLQMRHVNAGRDLNQGLEREEAAYQEISGQLYELHRHLAALQSKVLNALRGYRSFSRQFEDKRTLPTETANSEPGELALLLHSQIENGVTKLADFQRHWLGRFFGGLSPVILIIGLILIIAAICFLLSANLILISLALVAAVVVAVLRQRGFAQSSAAAEAVAQACAQAEHTYLLGVAAAQTVHEAAIAGQHEQYNATCADVEQRWQQAGEVEETYSRKMRRKLDENVPQLEAANEARRQKRLAVIAGDRERRMTVLQDLFATRRLEFDQHHQAFLSTLQEEEAGKREELMSSWKAATEPLYQAVAEMDATIAPFTPAWTTEAIDQLALAEEFPPAIKFASLHLDLKKSENAAPRESQLELPGPAQLSIPLALTFPDRGSLIFETKDSGTSEVIETFNNLALRILATTPPGRVNFTIIDPVGLGKNFAGLMHLTDFEETLINRRIWTQREQIEERLRELNEHIEKVIQLYLRNEFSTITEYNQQAGCIAEKYTFLIVADFPTNFSEAAVKRLQSIATSGPQCGIFTLLHWDTRQPAPDGLALDELRKHGTTIRREKDGWRFLPQKALAAESLSFDPPPEPSLAQKFVQKIGQRSIDSNRVEVPFTQISPKPEERWTHHTTNELKVAIGRTGASKLQYLAIGKGTRQHALFAGKTGSGKSTLFHVIATNLALSCDPSEVEFYLIDFKKGVEFKCYATHRLPHARVVAIESDREFGLSVLARVDQELKRRGDLFRAAGAQDVAGYRESAGAEPLPRTLLMIDEFQEFFVQDDEVAQKASLLLDRIVRQGRAFGIHVILGSQTLGGAYTLARTTLGQMVIRIALQCNEADAYLIMDDSNPAPRLLSRPGEGIYNDAAGAFEANSPFQVVWLPDEERDRALRDVRQLADQSGRDYPGPIVFEGNMPADVEQNAALRTALRQTPTHAPAVPKCWLGEPNSIKPSTEAAFTRQTSSNLLIVGQRDEAIATMLSVALISLAAQHPIEKAQFVVFDASGTYGADSTLRETAEFLPHQVTMVDAHSLEEVMNDLEVELRSRETAADTSGLPAIFVIIPQLQKYKKLRQEDDFNFGGSADSPKPSEQFMALLTEGSSYGIHVITTLDTFTNVTRFLGRKLLGEFGLRVVFQMSPNDSASLIDSPQANSLGLYRALFYNEQEGYLETFRPYSAPGRQWIQLVETQLGSYQPASL